MPALQDKVQEITKLVSKLPDSQQDSLLKSLKKWITQEKAERLRSSVEPNQVSMQEIVEEVRAVRQLRNDHE